MFLIDEVQTGLGASGKLWAHEHFDLPNSPDLMTFAKKMQVGGFYFKEELNTVPYRIFNTWLGDPARILFLEAILETIRRDKLIELNRLTGRKIFRFILLIKKSIILFCNYAQIRCLHVEKP